MTDRPVAEKLKSLKIFEGINDEYLAKLAPLCEEVSFEANTNIFNQYEKAVDVFVIVDGEVSLVICTPKVACRQIGVVAPGEMIGWSPLLGRKMLSDTAHANTAVTALRIDGEKLLDFCRTVPEFGFEFMRKTALAMAERLSGTRAQLLDVHGINLPEVQIESD